MSVRAKIIAYNFPESDSGCSNYSMNNYWGDNYYIALYLCGDFGRPLDPKTIIEVESDITGQEIRTQNTTIQRHNLTITAISPILQSLYQIDKCDVKKLIFTDTNEEYDIKNIDIEDSGDFLTPNHLVRITFEDEAITKVNTSIYTENSQKLAFWDNDNDGTADIDGAAEFDSASQVFNAWQLLYESDGVTPATSGNVTMLVYAVAQDTTEGLIGVFNGVFGDAFSDSTKWQSTQNLWDYFNVGDIVGHTERVQFDKLNFAQENGYFSTEQSEKAVQLRFELSIDGGSAQPTTLEYVYTVWGAFNSFGVQSSVTTNYGVTTIGKVNQKNTLSTIQDTYLNIGSTTASVTSAVLNTITNYSNQYVLGVSGSGERYYQGAFTSKGGYLGGSARGSYKTDNFTLSINDASPIIQQLNILNFTTGVTPYKFTFDWKYDRQTGLGGFPSLGDIVAAGDAKVFLDGVLVNTLPSIIPATLQVLGTQDITLPDTDVHTVKMYFATSSTYEIFTEFEVQLKPLF